MTVNSLRPGDVVALGQLQPGDVAKYLVNDTVPDAEFIVGVRRGTGVEVQYPQRQGRDDHLGDSGTLVRYLGKGVAAPPRIVMKGEESAESKLREAIRAAGFGVLEASNKWSIHPITEEANKAEEVEGRLIAENIDLTERVSRLQETCKRASAELRHAFRFGSLSAHDAGLCSRAVKMLENVVDDTGGKAGSSEERVVELEMQVSRLREELAWYGEQTRLCQLIHDRGDAGRSALSADGGQRARDALAATDPTKEEARPSLWELARRILEASSRK